MENTNVNPLLQISEITLQYYPKVKASSRPRITSSADAANLFRQSWDDGNIELLEQFKVMFLNRANKVIGILKISQGGIAGTVADPKLIFAAALKSGACGLILAHNHPSGNLTASQADINLTQKLCDGGKLLEVQVLDHIILTQESYYSFADEGLL
ncbi:JAB domain-containing protein [Pseudochryseolinea flava]|uniref:DNA repair protein n=1 Tax=Pseudochryseolinea flava TaxID=2059302 RepID=A0A364XZI6_9BACT|nr:JAB domain-containing protein [Pseudochryseolinea flava]RAV98872.1 DNA repair protein [Pseudochryseolinea flava]